MDTETPDLHLRVGDEVLVRGHEREGTRIVKALYNQERMPGGVILDKRVDGLFVSWNEDELIRAAPKPLRRIES
jgi:hypothetical protein